MGWAMAIGDLYWTGAEWLADVYKAKLHESTDVELPNGARWVYIVGD